MRKTIGLLTLSAFLAWGCSAGAKQERSQNKLIDALTLFVEAVQSDNFQKAFSYLTPAEKGKMLDEKGQVPDQVRRQLLALRLSTLAHKASVKLVGNRLEGIFEQLPAVGTAASPPGEKEPEVPSFQ